MSQGYDRRALGAITKKAGREGARFRVAELGRGERGSASLTHLPARPPFVLENVTGPPKVWPVDERKAS